MNPVWLDEMSWEMAEVYGAITDQILINLAKYFPYYKPGGTVPKSAFTYQATMLAQMGQVNRETVAIIRRGLKNADSALSNALEQAIIDSVSKAEKPLLKAVKAGIFSPPLVPITSPNQMRAFSLYYKQASDKLNLVNTVMLESTGSAYRQAVNDVALQVQVNQRIQATQTALDIGAGETVAGVSSWNEAVRHSINRMKENGITGFVDHAGRHWSAEAYTAMDIRTTVMNTGRAAVWETNENFGNDLYLVSYHNGARPLCYDWQNKVISSTNNARDTFDLDGNVIHVYAQSETTYGEAAGLFGINCKHYPSPFIPGVSIIRGEPQNPEENAKAYAESQEQRRLERKLREEKRDVMMAKAQGASPEEIKALQAKAHKTSGEIDSFCEQTGRARHRDREGVYTQRTFPDKDKYDVAQFEQTQKDRQERYYKVLGGEQSSYNAKAYYDPLTPKVPIAPNTSANPAATPTTAQAATGQATQQPQPQPMARPQGEQTVMQQFERYDPATKTDAEKLAQINPNYKTGERTWTYNCQRTVAAQEAVYRGYNVTAKAYNPKDPVADVAWRCFKHTPDPMKDPGIRLIGGRKVAASMVDASMGEWGDGSRAIIRVKWSHGGGHFVYARRVAGQTFITDPQSGMRLDFATTLKDCTTQAGHMWIMRVDNREFSDDIVYAIENVGASK